MPLTAKGEKIKKNMEKEYGTEKGKEVFYASQNKGTIKGTHKTGTYLTKFAEGFLGRMVEMGVPQDKAMALLKIAEFANEVTANPEFADGAYAALEKHSGLGRIMLPAAEGAERLLLPAAAGVSGRASKSIPWSRLLKALGLGTAAGAAYGAGYGAHALTHPSLSDQISGAGHKLLSGIKNTWSGMGNTGKALTITGGVGIPAAALTAYLMSRGHGKEDEEEQQSANQ